MNGQFSLLGRERSPPQQQQPDQFIMGIGGNTVGGSSAGSNLVSGNIMGFIHRFQALQIARDSSDTLIKDLLVYAKEAEDKLRTENNRLQNELDEAKLDLTDARAAQRDLQIQLQDAEGRAAYYSQGADLYRKQNQYVVALIDGEGLVFKPEFLRQGIEGGRRAATTFRMLILEQCGDHANEIQVMVKIVANLATLAKALKADGSIQNESDLRDFFVGFSQCLSSFDFVDIGTGASNLSSKIKESANWHMGNLNCRHVLLGVSHDPSYAQFLDDVLDDNTKDLVTVLEGVPMARELSKTMVNKINYTNTLFRSDRVGKVAAPGPPSGLVTVGSTENVPAAISYAGVTSAPAVSPPPTLKLPLAPKQTNVPKTAKQPPWNPGARGLDSPLKVNQSVLDNIKKRTGSSKLCNNHYLRGPCAKKDTCGFEHNYKPNAEEKVAISFLARLNPCTNGQECDIADCIYGHHCPSTVNGQCTHPYCKFRPDEHPAGTKYKSTYRNGEAYN
ncbi:hypothetical protein MCOR27_000466 [Pyricularia oryzae]|uniref:C3H1-type domain-containing protein n=1 Tax=Pyricularia grisea TaxID=148305 RepID=A0ABQ8NT42_PYRGI|nr:hypothetical protein MCOR01_003246 [Pyricularia oryzae]KAI6301194.1 hypothetical protein MCOR33_003256 [Pyricularia grisea]KAI6255725.1 hypothetical protein MCOR19_007773 [Pyricularia oryzae]KAI6279760.1 hypothetical protein MCOR26_004049 [Pyricularia oryzae]KAI6289148.1 hypothetical protein MCOR27_000466 [Pyricularia oryzae]